AMTLYTGNLVHTPNVYGTSPDIASGQQTTIIMGSGADTLTAFPHDALDNLTFNTPLGVGGGAGSDKLVIDDSAHSTPINYLFNNPFGPGTADVFGLGASGIGTGNDVETVSVLGGSGDDTFNVASFKTGTALVIRGGLGN